MENLLKKRLEPSHVPTIRLGKISFYNVLPVYHGIERLAPENLEITTDVPSALNRLMEENRLDISPVSSAAYAKNSGDWLILPDLSISCFGPVMSVRLACRRPMDALDGKNVLLTRDSGTAAALVKWLLSANHISAKYHTAEIVSPEDIPTDMDAALVIGNAALSPAWDEKFPHVYDLGEAWKKMQNLPFVFAVWAVRREFAAEHRAEVLTTLSLLFRSRAAGANRINEIAKLAAFKTGIPIKSADRYFSRLVYNLGEQEIAGLSAFFSGLAEKGLIQTLPELHFFE